ncbi:UDP-N-acetylmuramoyl-tripeptide--D-alanyl-D-alanine ligase [Brevibacterium sp. JNUCC-42]|nr:UDP-N-acetylmuramoyl-tripeptide--D-alanyl-D-alanine ligase [Brevibacterium sp. JNUCC-42]
MQPTTLNTINKMAQGMLIQGNPDTTVTSAHFDSRQLVPASLFVPLVETRDGHDFIKQAQESGAIAALVSDLSKVPDTLPKDFGLILVNNTLTAFQKIASAYRNQFTIPFIAVTGSTGKTTTKDIISHLLTSTRPICNTYKNFNNHIGLPYSLLHLDESHQAAVLELGMSHAGEIDLLASITKPTYSVITSIGEAHMEYFGTLEKIALAKAELLPHTAPAGRVYLNGDNEYLHKVKHLADSPICYYSVKGPADLWASDLTTDNKGTHFTVHFEDQQTLRVFMPLFGTYNVSNALPAIGIAREQGMSFEEIQQAMNTMSISGMRFEIHTSKNGMIVVNDAYNGNPLSMKASIESFADLFEDRTKVLILADLLELGSDSKAMHGGVGKYVSKWQDRFACMVTIGEDSRFIGEHYAGESHHFSSKEEAIVYLRSLLKPHSAVLLKASRGMKLETLLPSLQEI